MDIGVIKVDPKNDDHRRYVIGTYIHNQIDGLEGHAKQYLRRRCAKMMETIVESRHVESFIAVDKATGRYVGAVIIERPNVVLWIYTAYKYRRKGIAREFLNKLFRGEGLLYFGGDTRAARHLTKCWNILLDPLLFYERYEVFKAEAKQRREF